MKDVFEEYNNLWQLGRIKEPLRIMVGGNIGVGKSTFCKRVLGVVRNIDLLGTGIIRSTLQSLCSEEEYPYLFGHTYQLKNKYRNGDMDEFEWGLLGFEKQIDLVDKAIRKILDFTETEGRQLIIDGNHVWPKTIASYSKRMNVIGFIFKVSDSSRNRMMACGATHRRELNGEEWKMVRLIHDYLVDQADKWGVSIFEYEDQEGALRYLREKVAFLVEQV